MENWDVVYVVNAREYVSEKFRGVVEACGGQQEFERMWITERVDGDVVRGFARLGVL